MKKHGRKSTRYSIRTNLKNKIVLLKDALQDIKNMKIYILQTFRYREYAENFSRKIKSVIKTLEPFAEG